MKVRASSDNVENTPPKGDPEKSRGELTEGRLHPQQGGRGLRGRTTSTVVCRIPAAALTIRRRFPTPRSSANLQRTWVCRRACGGNAWARMIATWDVLRLRRGNSPTHPCSSRP